MSDFNEVIEKIKTIIENDKTILQNPEFIAFMNKFGFEYDNGKVFITNSIE